MTIPPAERPLVDCSVWWRFIFGVGVACLFLLQGFSSTSNRRISKGKVPRFFISINGWSGANYPRKQNKFMKKLSLFLLSLFLCSIGVPILAENAELVPAMVVQMVDGSKQVVQLDYTAVTDFSVLCSKGSLAVSVPHVRCAPNGGLYCIIPAAGNPIIHHQRGASHDY